MSFCISLPLLSELGDCNVPKQNKIAIDTSSISKQTYDSVMSSVSEDVTSSITVQNQNVFIVHRLEV